MKQIIDGKLYNTDTATCIGEYWNNMSRSDSSYLHEALYRTENGVYFLAGIGGAKTKYAIQCGNNSWEGGKKITPMHHDDAKEWAETHLTVKGVETEFGSEIEDA
jgi:hypothetical protein